MINDPESRSPGSKNLVGLLRTVGGLGGVALLVGFLLGTVLQYVRAGAPAALGERLVISFLVGAGGATMLIASSLLQKVGSHDMWLEVEVARRLKWTLQKVGRFFTIANFIVLAITILGLLSFVRSFREFLSGAAL